MLVKFFNHGTKKSGNTTANSVKNYLLNERAEQGTARIIRGNEPLTSKTIDLSEYNTTYTAGCLSFDKTECLNEQEKQEIMQSFENALLPNFDPTRYACYWVEHTDKDRLELNFVFAKIDLVTSKHLDVFQAQRDIGRLNAWKEIQLQKYDLKDPNDPINKQEIKPFYRVRNNGSIIIDRLENAKKTINDIIKEKINAGIITDRQGVIDTIQNEMVDKHSKKPPIVIKETKTSITVQVQNATLRLKGEYYSRDFKITAKPSQNAPAITEQHRQANHADYAANKEKRLAHAQEKFTQLCQIRQNALEKRYNERKHPNPTYPTTQPYKIAPASLQEHLDTYSNPNSQDKNQDDPTPRNDQSIQRPRFFIEYQRLITRTMGKFEQLRTIFDDTARILDNYRQAIHHRIDTTKQHLAGRKSAIEKRLGAITGAVSQTTANETSPDSNPLPESQTELSTSQTELSRTRAKLQENHSRTRQDHLDTQERLIRMRTAITEHNEKIKLEQERQRQRLNYPSPF